MSRPGSLRIEAGRLRGRRLAVPEGARPSSGRLRGALLAIWSERLVDSRFLDLFAGSGAVGLEAVSRGALEATFVESSRRAVRTLERNLRIASAGAVRLRTGAVPAELSRMSEDAERFDLIFADPPYGWRIDESLLGAIGTVAHADSLLALEHSRRDVTPSEGGGWSRTELRRYGESALSLYGRTA